MYREYSFETDVYPTLLWLCDDPFVASLLVKQSDYYSMERDAIILGENDVFGLVLYDILSEYFNTCNEIQ